MNLKAAVRPEWALHVHFTRARPLIRVQLTRFAFRGLRETNWLLAKPIRATLSWLGGCYMGNPGLKIQG
jgi:hypothetical protein